jgi:hypothetical protein
LRARVVPPPPEPDAAAAPAHAHGHAQPQPADPATGKPATHRCRYRPWAELLRHTFASDLEACEKCGGRLRLKALVTRPTSIERWLRALGEPTDAPPLSPARDPPSFKSRVLRRKLGELDAQLQMFEA